MTGGFDMYKWILATVVALVASQAAAFEQDRDRSFTGTPTWTLCSAETDTGVCEQAAGVDYAAVVTGYQSLLFDASQSTATSFTCDLYAGGTGVANSNANDLAAAGTDSAQINSVSMSATTEMISFSDSVFGVVWVNCSAITGGNVTVTVTGAK